MSVDVKHGDTVRLEVSTADATLTGVVNSYNGELGIWFAGSWFPLSRWGDTGITLMASAEPEQPEWADALVLRWDNGAVWVRRGDGFWFWNDRGPYDLKYLSTQPISVVIDKDGENVEAVAAKSEAYKKGILDVARERLRVIGADQWC